MSQILQILPQTYNKSFTHIGFLISIILFLSPSLFLYQPSYEVKALTMAARGRGKKKCEVVHKPSATKAVKASKKMDKPGKQANPPKSRKGGASKKPKEVVPSKRQPKAQHNAKEPKVLKEPKSPKVMKEAPKPVPQAKLPKKKKTNRHLQVMRPLGAGGFGDCIVALSTYKPLAQSQSVARKTPNASGVDETLREIDFYESNMENLADMGCTIKFFKVTTQLNFRSNFVTERLISRQSILLINVELYYRC
jgi:hypothetical protein